MHGNRSHESHHDDNHRFQPWVSNDYMMVLIYYLFYPKVSSRWWFLNLGIIDIWGWFIVIVWSHHMYCRMIGSISGLYPLDASSSMSPVLTTKTSLDISEMSPGWCWQNRSQLRSTFPDQDTAGGTRDSSSVCKFSASWESDTKTRDATDGHGSLGLFRRQAEHKSSGGWESKLFLKSSQQPSGLPCCPMLPQYSRQ